MAWGHALGFLAAMAVYIAVLSRHWSKDVTAAVTRAWFVSAGVYAVLFGLVEIAALAHGITGVYVGGPYAEAGLGYAVALLAQLLISAFVFAVGYDVYVELKRQKDDGVYIKLKKQEDGEKVESN